MKQYFKTLATSMIIFGLLCVILQLNQLSIGDSSNDFANQHVKFIEYIRNLIFSTHDIMPQLSMNYGLGQSFAALYYHGMYNPLIFISLILGTVPIKWVMYFIYALVIGLSSVSMHKLCRLNNFNEHEARILSQLMAFSGAIIFHFSRHPMFIYYLPFMIMSLISLHLLVNNQNKYLYSFMFSMVFFTNFFFAPIVSIIQFLYYLGLLIDHKKPLMSGLIKFIKAYMLGLMMGLIMLVPIYLFARTGIRGSNPNINYGMIQGLGDITASLVKSYNCGIGIVGITGLIYGILFSPEQRFKLPLYALLLTMIFIPAILFLNLGMYLNYKHIIYFIPVLWLVFGQMVFSENDKRRVILSLGLSVILVLACFKPSFSGTLKLLLTSEAIIILIMYQYRNKKVLISLLSGVIIAFTIMGSLTTVSNDDYRKTSLALDKQVKPMDLTGVKEISPYRTGEGDYNRLGAMDSLNPNLYTSLENPNFQRLLRSALELEVSNSARVNQDSSFNNYLLRNYLGITKFTDGKGKTSKQEAMPIVYGVADKDVYNISNLKQIDPLGRVLAINEGAFVDNEANVYKPQIKGKLVYETNKKLVVDGHKFNKTYKLPKALQKDGTLIITFDSDVPDDSRISDKITINGHTNTVMTNDFYGKNDNKKASFFIDTKSSTKELHVNVSKGKDSKGNTPITYSNLKVYAIDHNDVDKHKLKYYSPSDFKVDMSHYYEFTINQASDGYLATTIPYDNGFKIYVDGKQSAITKINDLFIGTKLAKGEHKIRIEYQIPGFKFSLLISSLAFAGFFISQIQTLRKRKSK